MKPLVLYHAKCNDGLTGAWAVKQAIPHAEFRAEEHQNPPPDVTGRDVIIVDFSYKRPVLLGMLELCRSMLILDHHDSAEKDLAGLESPKLTVVFDMKRSGAGIAWDHYHAAPRPWFVDVVEDADLWRWNRPETLLNKDSKALIEGIRAHPMAFSTLDELATYLPGDPGELLSGSDEYHQLLVEGKAILRAKHENVKAVAEYAYEVDLLGHKVLVANCPHVLNSEVGHELAKGRPFGVTYYEMADRRYKVSLRSDGFDTTQVSKKFGGGGHPAASGFTVKELPWSRT